MPQQQTGWIGQTLSHDRYEVVGKLGEGGMGSIYRARDCNLDTDVVIKVPHPVMLADAQFAARFTREIRSLVELSHPHIVKITDVGEEGGLPFAVMQYLSGGDLDTRRTRGADGSPEPIDPKELAEWLPEVGKTLDFVHSQGYVHRDIKPENILFDRHGNVYLSDFGIAKALAPGGLQRRSGTITEQGMVIGTPDYMAPELCEGKDFDGRVDQYALAITVYELLCGRPPFAATTAIALLWCQSHDKPRPLHEVDGAIPRGLSLAVDKALTKDAAGRYATCVEFAEAVLEGRSQTATHSASASETRVVRLKCPACDRVLPVKQNAAGRKAKCPQCGSLIQISSDLRQVTLVRQTEVTSTASHQAAGTQRGTPPPLPRDGTGVSSQSANVAAGETRIGSETATGLSGKREATWQIKRYVVLVLGAVGAVALIALVLLMRPEGKDPVDPEPNVVGPMGGASDSGSPADPFGDSGTAKQTAGPQDEITNSIGMKLKLIPADEFMMGSKLSAAEVDRRYPGGKPEYYADEHPRHSVRLTQPFYLGIHEVRVRDFQRFVTATGYRSTAEEEGSARGYTDKGSWEYVDGLNWRNPGFEQTPDHPVTCVSWADAEAFCQWLSEKEGRSYRLPTEAEWEYACRGGSETVFFWGDDPDDGEGYLNAADLSGSPNGKAWTSHFEFRDGYTATSPVGEFKANRFGLYDMQGSVCEWCSDWYDEDYYGESLTSDPQGPAGATYRVDRGGCWGNAARGCRSADRHGDSPSCRVNFLGFRVAAGPSGE